MIIGEMYMVNGKELNAHKLSELVKRSDFPLLNRFGISLLVGYENAPAEKQWFPYSKGLTALYRCNRHTLVQGQNQILKDALVKALADDYEDPSDRKLVEHLYRYMEEKTYRRCPMQLDFGSAGTTDGEEANEGR
jgi:hypothetical protein